MQGKNSTGLYQGRSNQYFNEGGVNQILGPLKNWSRL